MIEQQKLDRLAKVFLTDWDAQYQGPLRDYWGQRTVLQLQYAVQLAAHGASGHDGLITAAIEAVWSAYRQEGTITRETCQMAEDRLQAMAGLAKSKTLLCIGHAHIDMNWMWSYDETVSITLDTFRTVLDLMREYPDFTYGQSQAAVYEIVSRYDPQMLAEIRERVKEGRWEVTASTWVEADRNLPSAESMSRQLLYTRQYLSGLLAIPPESLDLDYEPDTFGHHRDVPEILGAAGIKYYYHCRGSEGPVLYRWRAPSGRSVIVFREPLWYNWTMDGRCALSLPEFSQTTGLDAMLRVYGVGDHGGGPTRRDLERIIDMNGWPVFPTYRFGTYHDFYRTAEQIADQLPVIEGELNFVFDGCYTTQTRIKRANRRAEAALFEAEAVGALTGLTVDRPDVPEPYRAAWQNVLFNQFHDILPGSGVADTREYAMGLYQQSFAVTGTRRMASLRLLAAQVDTADLAVPEDIRLSRSEGAGAGFPTGSGNLARVGRHAGLRRIFLVWNPLPFEREACCEVTVWDWPGDSANMLFRDGDGVLLEHQLIQDGVSHYWGHLYQTALVRIHVPAAGYATLVLDEAPHTGSVIPDLSPRLEHVPDYILENEYLRVRLSALNAGIISLIDKETGREMADPAKPLLTFRLIREDTARGMTAWTVGRYASLTELTSDIRFTDSQKGPLQQSLTWEADCGRASHLKVTLALQAKERQIRVDIQVRWQEIGSKTDGIPQLNLLLRPGYASTGFRYDVPLGAIDRNALAHDVPAASYGAALNAEGCSLLLAADSKQGFRGTEEGLALTLIRSSYDPDPWPEIGDHTIKVIVGLSDNSDLSACRTAASLSHPLVCLASQAHAGCLPRQASLLRLDGGTVRLHAIKMSEDGCDLIVRLCSLSDTGEEVSLSFRQPPRDAWLVDLHEQPLAEEPHLAIESSKVTLRVPPHALCTCRIRFN